MSTSTVIAGSGSNGINGTETGYSFPRLMAWCMRRELWENRSIYLAPLAAAGLLIFAVLIPVVKLMTDPHQLELGANVQFNEFWLPYAIIAAPVLAISAFVALAYCLTALQNERRDRSILFWKSLPVSDLITVLSKFAVPLVLVPLIAFVAAVFAQLTIFSITVAVFPHIAANAHLVWNGTPVTYQTVGAIWAEVPIGYISVGLFYGVLAMALWYAPVYAWLILVGGWARRMTFLWALAPAYALIIVERIGFGTRYLEDLFHDRLAGGVARAFSWEGHRLPDMTPLHFLSDPGLWAGLIAAGLFLGAAVMLRRYRQPI